MIYPKHTPVSAITHFDRSTKVVIECQLDGHEASVWMTKQPSCSTWFPATDQTADCGCSISGDTWWTAKEYNDGAEDASVYGADRIAEIVELLKPVELSGVMTEPEGESESIKVFDGPYLVAKFTEEEDAKLYVELVNTHLGSRYRIGEYPKGVGHDPDGNQY